jgi:hypothetical protein
VSDSTVSPTTAIANAESDPSTTTATSTSTTVRASTTTTAAARPAANDHGVGPDANGPAKRGLCTAYLALQDRRIKNLNASPFRNLVQAAADAGETVEDFCADVTATTSTTAEPKRDDGDHRATATMGMKVTGVTTTRGPAPHAGRLLG